MTILSCACTSACVPGWTGDAVGREPVQQRERARARARTSARRRPTVERGHARRRRRPPPRGRRRRPARRTTSGSRRARAGARPSAVAAGAIMRASCPPPTTATTGALTGAERSRAAGRTRRRGAQQAGAILAGPTRPRSTAVSETDEATVRPRRVPGPPPPAGPAAGSLLRARPLEVARFLSVGGGRVRRRPRPVQPAALRSRAPARGQADHGEAHLGRRRDARVVAGQPALDLRRARHAPARPRAVRVRRRSTCSARSIPIVTLAFSHYTLDLVSPDRGQRRDRDRHRDRHGAAVRRLQAMGLHGSPTPDGVRARPPGPATPSPRAVSGPSAAGTNADCPRVEHAACRRARRATSTSPSMHSSDARAAARDPGRALVGEARDGELEVVDRRVEDLGRREDTLGRDADRRRGDVSRVASSSSVSTCLPVSPARSTLSEFAMISTASPPR